MNNKDKKEFEKWFKKNSYDYYGYEKNNQEIAWQAACEYKQLKLANHIHKIELENSLLNQEIEKFKSYLEAWGKDE